MAIGIETARTYYLAAAYMCDHPEIYGPPVSDGMLSRASIAKVYAADVAVMVTNKAMELMGSCGYVRDYIDSPETGQDMENGEYFYRGLLKMAKRCQVIVATNSLIFMRHGNRIDLGQESLSRLVKATRELAAGFDGF